MHKISEELLKGNLSFFRSTFSKVFSQVILSMISNPVNSGFSIMLGKQI